MAVRRWVLFDPELGEYWTMPVNPYEMGSPYAPRSVASQNTSAVTGRALIWEGREVPPEITITGKVYSMAQWTQLLYWSRKPNAIQITDHYGRKLYGVIKGFDHTARRSIAVHSVVANTDARVYADYVWTFLCLRVTDVTELV